MRDDRFFLLLLLLTIITTLCCNTNNQPIPSMGLLRDGHTSLIIPGAISSQAPGCIGPGRFGTPTTIRFFTTWICCMQRRLKTPLCASTNPLLESLRQRARQPSFPAASTAATSISHQWRNTSFITRQRTGSRAPFATCLCQAHAYWTYTSGKCMTIFFVPKTRGNQCSSAWWRSARTDFSPIKIEATTQ